MKKIQGFAIVAKGGGLAYERYTYFTTDAETAAEIADEGQEGFRELCVVPASLHYDQGAADER